MSERRKRNSSKVNLTISAIFHTVLILGVVYLAAKEGMLGKQLKTIVATLEKEKKVDPPKPKSEEPKPEPPKPAEAPKALAAAPPPKVEAPPPAAAPPLAGAPAAAPAAVSLPAFDFNDGAKEVVTISDPKLLYKSLVESMLRANWNRPENIPDDKFVAEVELNIDPRGNVTGYQFVKGSGDAHWDGTVKAAVDATQSIGQRPPKGFPGKCVARFDVESLQADEGFKVSAR